MSGAFFPTRSEWTYRRTIVAGLYVLHAHSSTEGDVVLSQSEALHKALMGTVVMVSRHGEDDVWLRARHLSSDMNASWQMRRNHNGKMEFRSTGYHDMMGPCVCLCVGGRSPLYEYLVEIYGDAFKSFAVGARAAISNEISARAVPMRLKEMLAGQGINPRDIEDNVETSRDHELP